MVVSIYINFIYFLFNCICSISKKYEKLSPQEQVIFLVEAEKVFSAFDKIPDLLWEEEYNKYMEVLNKYKDIRLLRWTSN